MVRSQYIQFLLFICLLFSRFIFGAIELPMFFADDMVFQRDKPIAIWGLAQAHQMVLVTLDSQTTQAISDANGRWHVTLEAMNAGGPYDLTIKTTNDQRTMTGVYIGDVWVFSGQSNMQVSFDYFLTLGTIDKQYTDRFTETLETCNQDTQVRHFMVATKDAQGEKIRNTAENRWFYGKRDLVQHCNPIAYYFARTVSARTGVVTAAVRLAWGGQYIERFYEGAGIYEHMIQPWGDFAIKGVIWYQGENNLHKDGDRLGYALKLQLLIGDYRRLWKDATLPFYIVQLPPADYASQPFNDDCSQGVFLEAQRQALAIPFTAMANTADLGMANGLHQPQKYEVAQRLANIAFANVYGFSDAVAAGPQFKEFVREGKMLRVRFETFGDKLVTNDGKPPALFEILPAGKNQQFTAAQARIDGNSVIVWNDSVDQPADVRFAFRQQDMPTINLTNSAGIPAATFWAGATRQLHPGQLKTP